MYLEELKATLDKWMGGENTDEWLFESFRDSHIKSLAPEDAFRLLSPTVAFLLQEKNEFASIELLENILCLARVSKTTEVPQSILENNELLSELFANKDEYAKRKLQELRRFYRLPIS